MEITFFTNVCLTCADNVFKQIILLWWLCITLYYLDFELLTKHAIKMIVKLRALRLVISIAFKYFSIKLLENKVIYFLLLCNE